MRRGFTSTAPNTGPDLTDASDLLEHHCRRKNMIQLACIDGGLICIPTLVVIIGTVLGWLGIRRCQRHSDCDGEH